MTKETIYERLLKVLTDDYKAQLDHDLHYLKVQSWIKGRSKPDSRQVRGIAILLNLRNDEVQLYVSGHYRESYNNRRLLLNNMFKDLYLKYTEEYFKNTEIINAHTLTHYVNKRVFTDMVSNGYSITELAEFLGITRSTFSKYKNY